MARRRTRKRAAERAAAKLHRDVDRLIEMTPGGRPENPIEVGSPAVVEVRAENEPCPHCQGVQHVKEHVARTIDGARLRVVRVMCGACGNQREMYFRIAEPLMN